MPRSFANQTAFPIAMACKMPFLLLFSIFCFTAAAANTVRRQSNTSTLAQYLQNVQTAAYAVTIIQANNASSECQNTNLVSEFNVQGLNGLYGQQLM